MEQKTMKALVYHGPGEISLDDVPVPQIQQTKDVIGKVTISAICTSDVHVKDGHLPMVKPPRILGHEFVVEAVEVGDDVKTVKPGKHYLVMPASNCYECEACKAGRLSACTNGGTFGVRQDGCQAEFIRIPDADGCMYEIPEGVTDEQVVLLGDMLATAYFGIKNADVKEGDKVGVVGLGPVGMCAAELLTKMFKCTVVGLTRDQNKIDLAKKHGVIIDGISPKTDDVAARVAELTDGKGFSAVVETPGNQASMELACSIIGYGGVISTIAIFGGPINIPMNQICYKNATIRMGVQYLDGIKEMMAAILDGTLDTTWMLTHRDKLSNIMEGYRVFGGHTETCIKWIVEADDL